MSAAPSEVKDDKPAQSRRGFSRHLEGWQAGVVAVAIALAAALLAVPHRVAPETVPLPRVDRIEASRLARTDRERAAAAEKERLPFEVRAVGELVRAFGKAEALENPIANADALRELRSTTELARKKYGDTPLVELCSTQTEMFVQALARWERGSDESAEISELGGNFLAKARASLWLADERTLLLDDAERRVLFRVRWVDLAGVLGETAFRPSANDWRIYYRFLLRHPERGPGLGKPAEEQLRYVAAAEKVDPDYPGLFARGVLYYRLSLWQKSADAFRGFLAKSSSGPWRLRARNHLLAAAENARQNAAAP